MTDPDEHTMPQRTPAAIDPPAPSFYIVDDVDILRRVVAGLQAPPDTPPESTGSQSSHPVSELKEESPCTR